MIIAGIRRAGSESTTRKPEVMIFEEPGVKIKNKTEGKGKSKKSKANIDGLIDREVKKIYKKEKAEGNALPAVLKDMELTTALRTEIFELGASTMELDTRGKVLEKWKKNHRTAAERLEQWKSVHKNKLSYPELIAKVKEHRAEAFVAKEREYHGDDMVKVDYRRRTKHKRGYDVPDHLFKKHMSQPQVGKIKDGVLRLTNEDVKNIRFKAGKKRKR